MGLPSSLLNCSELMRPPAPWHSSAHSSLMTLFGTHETTSLYSSLCSSQSLMASVPFCSSLESSWLLQSLGVIQCLPFCVRLRLRLSSNIHLGPNDDIPFFVCKVILHCVHGPNFVLSFKKSQQKQKKELMLTPDQTWEVRSHVASQTFSELSSASWRCLRDHVAQSRYV